MNIKPIQKTLIITIVLSFFLIAAGGLVHYSGSSLSCPDWPLCYGQVIPEKNFGISLALVHRFLAFAVVLCSFIVLFFSMKSESKDFIRRSLTLILLLLLQSLLGAITVLYKLPTIVSTLHLFLSLFFILRLISFYKENSQSDEYLNLKETSKWRDFSFLALVSVFAQILIGGLLRHSGASSACGVGLENSLLCFDPVTFSLTFWPSLSHGQFHMFHRLSGVFVTICAFFVALKALRSSSSLKMQVISFSTIFFLLLQPVLGVLTVTTSLSFAPSFLHLVFAIAVLLGVYEIYKEFVRADVKAYGERPTFLGDLIELTKPRLSMLVIVTALFGVVLSPDKMNISAILLFSVFMFALVGGACALNCYIERDIDGKMERTKNRALPSGRLSPKFVLIYASFLTMMGAGMLAVYVNILTALLGLLAAVLYIYAYTPLKKKSALALFVGAVPGALPPMLGWTAVTGRVDLMAWFLFLILFIWQVPHFMAISIFHQKDYKGADIKVYPDEIGVQKTKWNILFTTIIMLGISLLPFFWGLTGASYLWMCLFLGFLMIGIAAFGFRVSKLETKAWAKKYFYATLFYLPALYLALVVA